MCRPYHLKVCSPVKKGSETRLAIQADDGRTLGRAVSRPSLLLTGSGYKKRRF